MDSHILRGSSKLCLRFGSSTPVLEGFTDVDMAGDFNNRKSTSGYLFTFARGVVSWQSKLQKCMALSTLEVECTATTETTKEILWLKRFLLEFDLSQKEYIVWCNSQSALNFSKNPIYHAPTKHIDMRFH